MESVGNGTEENAFTNEFAGKDNEHRDFKPDTEKPNKEVLEAKRDEYIKLAVEKVLKGKMFGLIKKGFSDADDFIDQVVDQLYKDHGHNRDHVLDDVAWGGDAKKGDLMFEIVDETYTAESIAKVAQDMDEVPFAIKDELKERHIVPRG